MNWSAIIVSLQTKQKKRRETQRYWKSIPLESLFLSVDRVDALLLIQQSILNSIRSLLVLYNNHFELTYSFPKVTYNMLSE